MIRPLNRPMITVSIMLATVMQVLDSTIANVALPHMQGSVSASQNQIAWVLTAYIVATAIATPLTGWVCDRFGQKRVFLVSIAGFTLASMLCGLSESLAEIVAARLLQGIFGATLVPLSQVVLMEINPPEKYGPAMAIWSMGVMMGPILGPALGGWLTDGYNWRWVFFINLPVGAFAFYGVWRFIRPTPGAGRHKFDVYGFATSTNSLLRNIGSSIGIALVQSLLVRNTHIMHASLTAHINYSNPAWAKPAVAAAYNLSTPAGAAALDNAITQQATMIAYIDNFWLMLGATLLVTPLLLLFKPPRRPAF
jgi:DHA2 family multidrug resistance protein